MLVIAYYSNPGYKFMVDRLERLCDAWNFPFMPYSRTWLEQTEFYASHRNVLDVAKGNGYWAWKPYIIKHALQKVDQVLYLDSSVVPDSKMSIVDFISRSSMVSALGTQYIQKDWTKRICFRNMGCDSPRYWNSVQVWAGVIAANREGLSIIDEWLMHCTVLETISDSPCADNFDGFMDHRHDQSILTNLLVKHYQNIPYSNEFKDVVQYE